MTAQSPSVGIVVSRADVASVHIGATLRSLTDWSTASDETVPDASGGGTVYRTDGAELREFDDLHLHLEEAADPFPDPSLLVFASRHSGESGPLLSAHFTGNFGPAEYGGEEGTLSRAAPDALDRVITSLDRYAPDPYEVSMECTHHGPSTIDVPSLFVELGSDEPQWSDPAGAKAVARAILDLREVVADGDRRVVGFGGGHYAPRFGRVLRETDWTVGHVIADWSLETVANYDDARIRSVFERSGARRALVDRDDPELTQRIESLGFEVVSETWLRETTGVPRSLVTHVEGTLGPIADGVRFGTRAGEDLNDPSSIAVVTLNPDLMGTVNGVDHEAVLEAVRAEAVAFQTKDSGSRATGRVAVDEDSSVDRLVSALVSILDRRYDRVDLEDGVVVIHDRAFDPNAARELGVPEGPAFGELSAGEAVEVDGRVVDPAAVHTDRTTRLSVYADHPARENSDSSN